MQSGSEQHSTCMQFSRALSILLFSFPADECAHTRTVIGLALNTNHCSAVNCGNSALEWLVKAVSRAITVAQRSTPQRSAGIVPEFHEMIWIFRNSGHSLKLVDFFLKSFYLEVLQEQVNFFQYKHSTGQHGTARHSTAQHSTAQHSTCPPQLTQHLTAGQNQLLRFPPVWFCLSPSQPPQ